MMCCCRRRNKRRGAENYGEVMDGKELPDFMASVLYTSAVPGLLLEKSQHPRAWCFGRAGTPPGSLQLLPLPVILLWSCRGRKNVSLLTVTAQAFSSSSVKKSRECFE